MYSYINKADKFDKATKARAIKLNVSNILLFSFLLALEEIYFLLKAQLTSRTQDEVFGWNNFVGFRAAGKIFDTTSVRRLLR